MTTDEQIKALTERVAALEAKKAEVAWAEQKVLEAARAYARMKTMGYFLDKKGFQVLVSDREEQTKVAEYMLRQAAEAILRAETSGS